MIHARLTIPATKDFAVILAGEAESFTHPRASYTVEKDGRNVLVDVHARDGVALKTVVSSIARLVTVYEKATKQE